MAGLNLFVLSFFVFAGYTVGHGENSLQSNNERESTFAHLMYLFIQDINDINNENRVLKEKVDAMETEILDFSATVHDRLLIHDINDIINENRGLKEKVEILETQIQVLDSKTEEKLLEKMVRMEHGTGLMKDEVRDISLQVKNELEIMRETAVQIKEEQDRLLDLIEELRWEEWGPWGSCAASCSGGVGERLQSRARRKKAPDDTTSQTESRPCSSVQFAGCLHPNNTDQFFAVAYDYSHTLAQAACTAMASGGYIRALKRTCSSSASDCAAVCKTLGQTCFNSLHVYSGSNAPPLNRDTTEQKSMMMYKYNACGGGCGPNFCCCKS